MKIVIRKLLGTKVYEILVSIARLFYKNGIKSYSQEGEDIILSRLLEKSDKGFYVDVGAHHPYRFSNTYCFYKKGWRGINIDATPGSMRSFRIVRRRDINIEIPVSTEESELDYYLFEEPALNSFNKDLSEKRVDAGCRLRSVVKLKTRTLGDLLDEYLPNGQKIDFMTIDVEGFDLNVLKSSDWSRYRPEYVLVEVIGSDLGWVMESEVTEYLADQNYSPCVKTVNTVFYMDNKLNESL
ncbi:MAG: FkbM family methyltransferase [Candidatus Sedimenticola sp. PURPLELP]